MRDTVWVIARTGQAGAPVVSALRGLSGTKLPLFACLSVEGPGGIFAPLPAVSRVCGVVLVVDGDALVSQPLADLARGVIAITADRSDFCVVPWLNGVTTTDLDELGAEGNALAAALIDEVHLDAAVESLSGAMNVLRAELETAEQWAMAERLAGWSRAATRAMGRMASIVSRLLVVTALVAGVLTFYSATRSLVMTHPLIRDVAALSAWAVVAIFAIRCGYWLRTLNANPEVQRGRPTVVFDCLGSAALAMYASLVGTLLGRGRSLALLTVGLGVGLMLATLVRAGRRAAADSVSIGDIARAIRGRTLVSQLYRSIESDVVAPGLSFYDPPYKRMFISYCRSSAWSRAVAERIEETLRDSGAYVFLDRPSLRIGFSWRRQIRSAIADANVFIAVLDDEAVQREWVVAEFAAAFRTKSMKGTPEIFVVHPAGIEFERVDAEPARIFAELLTTLSRNAPRRMRSQMAAYDRQRHIALCRALRIYPIAGQFGWLSNMAIGSVISLLHPVLSIASLIGLPLVVVNAALLLARVNPEMLIDAHPGFVAPVAGLMAVLAGFSLRMVVYVWSDVRRYGYSYVPGFIDCVQTLSFAAGVALCTPRLSLTAVTGCVVLGFIGLQIADVFSACMRTWADNPRSPRDIRKWLMG